MEAVETGGWRLLLSSADWVLFYDLGQQVLCALFGIVAAVATNSITMVQALGGYAEANVWLIVAAVFFFRGIINSGLGKRIAYTLIHSFGY